MRYLMLNEYKKEFFSFDQDWGYVIYPENISKDIPVVLHFHGNRGYVKDGGADWLDEPKKQNFFNTIQQIYVGRCRKRCFKEK